MQIIITIAEILLYLILPNSIYPFFQTIYAPNITWIPIMYSAIQIPPSLSLYTYLFSLATWDLKLK